MKKFSYDALCTDVFYKSKQDLNLNDLFLSFDKLKNNTEAFFNINTICVNENSFKASKICDIIDTIFHETRHYYQHTKLEKKKLNTAITPTLPIPHANDMVYLINEQKTGLSPFFLYYTADNEKDARDYAEVKTKEYLQYLIETCATTKGKKFFEKQLNKYTRYCEENHEKYIYRLDQLKTYDPYYKNKIKERIFEMIDHFSSDYEIYKKTCHIEFEAQLLAYCDDEIANKIYDFSKKYNSIKTLLVLVNSPFVKVSKDMLNDCFKMIKSFDVELDDVILFLSNWDESFIRAEYNQFVIKNKECENIIKNEQKSTKTL